MSKIPVVTFKPSQDDILLLDTNILIHLFYPIMSKPYMSAYEKLYADALSKHCTLLLPALQLSEFINRCIRFQFSLYCQEHGGSGNLDFKKDYRSTEDYSNHMNVILNIVKNDILKNFKPIDDSFTSMKPDSLLIYGFSYDFNDALLVQLAELYNASIVTHDSDFGNYQTKQNIITDNRLLLMFK